MLMFGNQAASFQSSLFPHQAGIGNAGVVEFASAGLADFAGSTSGTKQRFTLVIT